MAYEEVRYRWTGNDWSNAQDAKKAKEGNASPLPKILVTPYGLSPFQFNTSAVEGGTVVTKLRVYKMGDSTKTPLIAWDIRVGDDVMLPLGLCTYGQKSLADRFYKKGQTWVPMPDGVSGSTLLELCRALYGTGKPEFDVYHYFSPTKPETKDGAKSRVDKTKQEWEADAAVRERVLAKLVDHWKNTEYHYEKWRKGLPLDGSLPVPLTNAAGASVMLNVVMAEPPPKPEPKPVTPSGDPDSGTSVVMDTKSPGGSGPPVPYNDLPDPLKATLLRSYQDRADGVVGSEKNLNTIWGKGSDVWQCIDKGMSWEDINTMVRVYQRIEAVDKTGELWRTHILYFIRAYTGGVYAIEMVYKDQEAITKYLNSLTMLNVPPLLARERGIFQCMHKGTTGWREVSSTDQLHISVSDGTIADAVEDCHIDQTSFTKDRNPDGTAVPAWEKGIDHFYQSQLKWMPIKRPFVTLEEIYNEPADSEKRPTRPDLLKELEDWHRELAKNAVSGETGHQKGVELLRKIWEDRNPPSDFPVYSGFPM